MGTFPAFKNATEEACVVFGHLISTSQKEFGKLCRIIDSRVMFVIPGWSVQRNVAEVGNHGSITTETTKVFIKCKSG